MPSTSNKRNKALNRLKAFASPWVATNRPFVMSMSQRPTCWECRKSCIGGESIDGRNTRGFEEKNHIVWIRGLIIADDTMKTHWLGKHPNTVSFSSFFNFFRTKHAVLMNQWIKNAPGRSRKRGAGRARGPEGFCWGCLFGTRKKQLDWLIDHDLRIYTIFMYIWIYMDVIYMFMSVRHRGVREWPPHKGFW